MAYLNLDPDYFGHPKTKRIVGILGKRAEVFPIRLWCYCAKYHAQDGKLRGYSAEEIEGLIDWDGEKGQLTAALVKVGFLKGKTGNYEVNDWLDHEGHIVKFKERSKLANKKRWDKITPTRSPKDEVKESPLPNHTLPNLPNQLNTPPEKPGAVNNSKTEKPKTPVFNEQETTLLKQVLAKTNIYALLEEFKNLHKDYPPKELLLRVCQQFLDKGDLVKEPYAYLKAALHRAAQDQESLGWKNDFRMAQSIKDILGGVANGKG